MDSGPVGHLPMIVCMKHRPIIAALAIAGAAWTLTLGTVAVVEFGRLVDVLAAPGIEATAPVRQHADGGALAVPVQYSASADAQAIARALRDIANMMPGSANVRPLAEAIDKGLCDVAAALRGNSSTLLCF